ncbi:hypothetical protein AB0D59_35605 [Streptomyces sp. NPDC048417]|uniref:hypothetical protein n=1 Tax=Streptomyces sp. NPDC048417 TaxID=3155387 RepID=UPI0034454B1B
MMSSTGSPFGRGVGKGQFEHAKQELDRLALKSQRMVREALEEAERAEQRAEMERARANEAEAKLRAERATQQRFTQEITAKQQELARMFQELQAPPDVEALRAELAAAIKERDTALQLLSEAEQQRDAALRARDAARARTIVRSQGGQPDGPVGVRALLTASTIHGILEQAEQVCTLLRMTCDPDEAAALEHHVSAHPWRARLADALATIQAYAEAKQAAIALHGVAGPSLMNLQAYCRDATSGALLAVGDVALSESRHVSNNKRLLAERTFRVPKEVDPSRRVVMAAHIRIGSGKPPAPRMHFFDDTDKSGMVVIGYLGAHLRNASTN